MRYLKQICCLLIVMLVMVACSCVNISSVARAEETRRSLSTREPCQHRIE